MFGFLFVWHHACKKPQRKGLSGVKDIGRSEWRDVRSGWPKQGEEVEFLIGTVPPQMVLVYGVSREETDKVKNIAQNAKVYWRYLDMPEELILPAPMPCPFCGCNKAKHEESYWMDNPAIHYIKCPQCGARGGNSKNYKAALLAWNQRQTVN